MTAHFIVEWRKGVIAMAWDERCFNFDKVRERCKALLVDGCPENCSSRVVDPLEYIEMLEALIEYNKEAPQVVADHRKEIRYIRRKFDLPEYEIERSSRYVGWKDCYYEDKKRGERGGSSEQNSNPSKPRTTDNRLVETKMNSIEREEYNKALQEWELEHGKLDRLGRGLSRNKVDEYTGKPIE